MKTYFSRLLLGTQPAAGTSSEPGVKEGKEACGEVKNTFEINKLK